VIKLTQSDFLRTLENAIRYGAAVLLENVQETLDPSLEPVLLKQIFKRGGQRLLRLGDTDVPYMDEFRFFITTKLTNPHYMPEICIKVTIINFTVTLSGLEDQLLVNVIQGERPDLEKKNAELVVSIAEFKKSLKEIEDKILHMLANSKGNILDDVQLIDTLGQSKVTSTQVNKEMKEAEQIKDEIRVIREKYRIVATRGSIVYFCIADLGRVDPMYQYSLQFYQALFKQRLHNSQKSDLLEERLQILIDDITKSMYQNICRGLFESHKMLYSFLITIGIEKQADRISPIEWQIYQLGVKAALGPLLPKDGPGLPQVPSDKRCQWLTNEAGGQTIWDNFATLATIIPDTFGELLGAVKRAPSVWSRITVETESPHNVIFTDLPSPFGDALSDFQKLLLLRACRPEKTVFGTRVFTTRQLGEEFTVSPPFDLAGCFRDSTPYTPLIFILSPGADINDYLLKLAETEGKADSMRIISLGQGQGPIAESLMKQGRLSGDWVCLQNCHLSVSWLPKLEQDLEQANEAQGIHAEFRLWLTSMPSKAFPVPVLQNGIKITNEPPKGIKANLSRTFADMSEPEFSECVSEHKRRAFKKLIFGLAFYNAACIERRKYGALGWNIPYQWMNSDLKTGMMQVRDYLEEQDEVPYRTLNVMIADVSYGGRVTDKMDKITNANIMAKYFTPDIMKDTYRFDPAGTYFAPPDGTLQATRDYVVTLPVDEVPETFGLHPNADVTYQQKLTSEFLNHGILA